MGHLKLSGFFSGYISEGVCIDSVRFSFLFRSPFHLTQGWTRSAQWSWKSCEWDLKQLDAPDNDDLQTGQYLLRDQLFTSVIQPSGNISSRKSIYFSRKIRRLTISWPRITPEVFCARPPSTLVRLVEDGYILSRPTKIGTKVLMGWTIFLYILVVVWWPITCSVTEAAETGTCIRHHIRLVEKWSVYRDSRISTSK